MDNESLPEEVKELYANFGLAIYHAQVLEYGLVNALVFLDHIPNKRRLATSPEQWAASVDSFMEKKFEFTLGRVIRELEAVTEVDPGLQDLLSKALKRRNWLAHGYFKDRAEDFLTVGGRAKMLTELEESQELLISADAALEQAIKPARERIGLTDEVLAATYAKLRVEIGADG